MRTDEVARILDVSPRTVRNYVARGELPRVRINSRVTRFNPGDVVALLRRKTEQREGK